MLWDGICLFHGKLPGGGVHELTMTMMQVLLYLGIGTLACSSLSVQLRSSAVPAWIRLSGSGQVSPTSATLLQAALFGGIPQVVNPPRKRVPWFPIGVRQWVVGITREQNGKNQQQVMI